MLLREGESRRFSPHNRFEYDWCCQSFSVHSVTCSLSCRCAMVLDCKHLVVVSSYAYCHQALAQLSKPSHRQEDHLSCGAICDLFCGGSCLCKSVWTLTLEHQYCRRCRPCCCDALALQTGVNQRPPPLKSGGSVLDHSIMTRRSEPEAQELSQTHQFYA